MSSSHLHDDRVPLITPPHYQYFRTSKNHSRALPTPAGHRPQRRPPLATGLLLCSISNASNGVPRGNTSCVVASSRRRCQDPPKGDCRTALLAGRGSSDFILSLSPALCPLFDVLPETSLPHHYCEPSCACIQQCVYVPSSACGRAVLTRPHCPVALA